MKISGAYPAVINPFQIIQIMIAFLNHAAL